MAFLFKVFYLFVLPLFFSDLRILYNFNFFRLPKATILYFQASVIPTIGKTVAFGEFLSISAEYFLTKFRLLTEVSNGVAKLVIKSVSAAGWVLEI